MILYIIIINSLNFLYKKFGYNKSDELRVFQQINTYLWEYINKLYVDIYKSCTENCKASTYIVHICIYTL